MPRQSWNTNDSLTFELDMADEYGNIAPENVVWKDGDTDPVLQKIAPFLYQFGGHGELVIEFNSKGYNDPGNRGSLNDPGYAPEGSDERSLGSAYLFVNGKSYRLPEDLSDELFEHFHDDIQNKEIETDYDDSDARYDAKRNGPMVGYESVSSIANMITEDPDIFSDEPNNDSEENQNKEHEEIEIKPSEDDIDYSYQNHYGFGQPRRFPSRQYE